MRKVVMLSMVVALAAVATPALAQERRFSYSTGPGGPRLGVQVIELTEELRTFFGAQKDAGVLVAKVEPGSAGAAAGIRVGDVLVTVGGTTVDQAWDVRRALGEKKEGDTIPATVMRDRRPVTLAVRVPKAEPGPGPEGFLPPDGMGFSMPPGGYGPGGMRMWNLGDIEKRLDEVEKRLDKLEAH
jgi:membrane-associated protease RseP (regulator of RpoE activity)